MDVIKVLKCIAARTQPRRYNWVPVKNEALAVEAQQSSRRVRLANTQRRPTNMGPAPLRSIVQ